jgi:hypothetical protein
VYTFHTPLVNGEIHGNNHYPITSRGTFAFVGGRKKYIRERLVSTLATIQ